MPPVSWPTTSNFCVCHKHIFGLAALLDLDLQPSIGLGQRAGAFRNQQLQAFVQPTKLLLRAPHSQQSLCCRDQFVRLDRLHEEAVRPAIQRHRTILRAR